MVLLVTVATPLCVKSGLVSPPIWCALPELTCDSSAESILVSFKFHFCLPNSGVSLVATPDNVTNAI